MTSKSLQSFDLAAFADRSLDLVECSMQLCILVDLLKSQLHHEGRPGSLRLAVTRRDV
jgi:hypothetical protein